MSAWFQERFPAGAEGWGSAAGAGGPRSAAGVRLLSPGLASFQDPLSLLPHLLWIGQRRQGQLAGVIRWGGERIPRWSCWIVNGVCSVHLP